MISTRSSLGSTELADVDICGQLFKRKHVDRLVPIVSRRGKLVGSILHVGTRYWYAQFIDGMPIGSPAHREYVPWFYERTMLEEIDRAGRGHPEWIEQGKLVIEKYIEKFGEVDRAWKIIAIEREFSIGLDHPELLRALERLDAIPHWRKLGTAHELWTMRAALRPSVRVDFAAERPDGIQSITDYKSTIGDWGKLKQWKDDGEFSFAWQPHEYQWIAQRVTDEHGQLVFPRLADFWIRRVQTVDPFLMDAHPLTLKRHLLVNVPDIIVRQLARRHLLRAEIEAGFEPAYSPWACWHRYGACDYFPICWSGDPQTAIALHFQKEEEQSV